MDFASLAGAVAIFEPTLLTWIVGIACLLLIVRMGLACAWAVSDWRHLQETRKLEREALLATIARERKAVEMDVDRKRPWEGWRKFQIDRVEDANQSGSVRSFYLVPHDRKPIPSFHPGQFLTFRMRVQGQVKPPVRCYSLSDGPRDDYFRISVKQVPDGLVSGWLHDKVWEGDILDVRAPGGKFYLDLEENWPAVLIGGGVGITPFLSMLEALDPRRGSREVWMFYAAPNGDEFVNRERFEELARKHADLRVFFFYSHPNDEDKKLIDAEPTPRKGVVSHATGRIDSKLFAKLLPDSAPHTHHFYLCGPPGMMKAVSGDLANWGVAEKQIHMEAFGPASVPAKKAPDADKPAEDAKPVPAQQVTFARSDKTAEWTPDAGTLLEFAEAQGVSIDAGCCAGDCGTCITAIKEGSVHYAQDPSADVTAGCCLPCVAIPDSKLVLDA